MAMSQFDGASADETLEQQAETRRLRDLELIAAYREGDESAGQTLFDMYRKDAYIAARNAAPDHDTAEDFAAEAFAKIFDLLKRGKGPQENFRYYLRATIRTIAADWYQTQRNTVYTDNFEPFEVLLTEQTPPQEGQNPAAILEAGEGVEIVAAFQRLPERWQHVIFRKVIEGRSNPENAEELGITTAHAAVLYQRAREGLRKEYLTEIATGRSASGDPECQTLAADLAASVSGRLSRARRARLDTHIAHCTQCRSSRDMLEDLSKRFDKKAIAPALAGVAGALILPTINNGSRAAATMFAAPWVKFAIIGVMVAALVTIAIILAVSNMGPAETRSEINTIVIEDDAPPQNSDVVRTPSPSGTPSTETPADPPIISGGGAGACVLTFEPSTSGTALATLTTSNTGTAECTMRAWVDDRAILGPFAVTTSQTTVLTRPGELLVELAAGGKTETRTFVVEGR